MLQQGLDVSDDDPAEDITIDPNEKQQRHVGVDWSKAGSRPVKTVHIGRDAKSTEAPRPTMHEIFKAVSGRGKVSPDEDDVVSAFMDEFEDVHGDGTEMVPKADEIVGMLSDGTKLVTTAADPHGLRTGVDMAKMRMARREARRDMTPGSRDAGRARRGRYTVMSDGADAVVHFGKHRDHPLSEIAKEAPDYLRWMLKEDFDEELKAIARRVLKRKSDEETIGGLLDDPDDCPF